MSQEKSVEVDKSLYSRQLYTIGKDAMEAIKNTSVLISGMSGLGIEIAKNLILTGVKSVTLHDSSEIRVKELSSNYYANMEDISKPRVCVRDKLAGLNPYVNVTTSTDFISDDLIKRHQIVVICDRLPQTLTDINDICRQYRTKFICASTIGLMGSVFCDFGEKFIISDADGENPSTGIILSVQDDIFQTDEAHGLYVGDTVSVKIDSSREYIDEVVKVISKNQFKTQKCKMKNKIFASSTFTQVKQPVTIDFKSLSESLVMSSSDVDFSMVYTDDFSRQKLLHDFMFSFFMFVHKYKVLPKPWNDTDADEIMETMKFENDSQKSAIKKLCYTSSGKIVILDSVIGSIVAQEVVKASSKKYTPIKQWLYMERTDLLPDDKLPEEDFEDIPEDRYYGQTLIFGKTMQKQIADSNIFIVGAGAIGCEHLKNFSMMGVRNITITDMDRIEKSNLNRQFLFRYEDIGNFKSDSAKKAISQMNPDINITSQQNKICHDTLNIYDKNFFSGFTCILTALDNVDARKFVDNLCLQHGKHMIDSGTLGTKGNTQVVIPFLTETYSQSRDPPEKEIPVCTLKNFPYLIEHCIQWARNMFEGFFVKAPQNFLEYKKNPEKIKNMAPSDLTEIVSDINFVRNNLACHSKECIKFAYKLWHESFRDEIYNLTQKFPIDSELVDEKTKEKIPFWAGTKKFPKVANFDSSELHIAFIEAFANLWAEVCMLEEKITQKQITQFLKKAIPPVIISSTGDIASNEKEQKELEEQARGKTSSELINMLPDLDDIKTISVKVLEFEKDDDTNFHVDFVTSASNLRATNYGIPNVDKFKTKGIAGKIIPAVVTTTSLVSGLVSAEFTKVVRGENRLEKYYNTFSNLALPVFSFSEPIKITKQKIGQLEYSIWDNFIFSDMTVKQFMIKIEELVGDDTLTIKSISVGVLSLFSVYYPANLVKKRMGMKISEIYTNLSKELIITEYLPVAVCIGKKQEEEGGEEEEFEEEDIMCQIKV